jgi:hypothetical protein
VTKVLETGVGTAGIYVPWPTEAVEDFFGMGIDLLVLGDIVLEK